MFEMTRDDVVSEGDLNQLNGRSTSGFRTS